MRDTSHNLVINKQTPHPIKHLTSPCSSRITYAAWAHVEGISKSAKGVLYISPGLGQGRPPHAHPVFISSTCLSVCLSVGWWEHHPDTSATAPLSRSAFIFRCRAQITRLRLCTRRRGEFARGFVNTCTFCERRREWDEVTDCRSCAAAAEGKGGGGPNIR